MSKIPQDLWPASYHCSAYLLNRTPNRGYDGTNQFWVWNSRKGIVAKKGDIAFDEKIQYDPKNPYVEDGIVNAVPLLSTLENQINQ
jgi:hypothetical protein